MAKPRNSKFEWQDRFLEAKALNPTARFIGFVLATKDNGDGSTPFMSTADIVKRTGLSDKTVRLARKALEEAGWITVERRGGRSGNGATWATRYRLTIPEPKRLGWGAAALLDAGANPVREEADGPQSQPVRTEPQPVTGAGSTGHW